MTKQKPAINLILQTATTIGLFLLSAIFATLCTFYGNFSSANVILLSITTALFVLYLIEFKLFYRSILYRLILFTLKSSLILSFITTIKSISIATFQVGSYNQLILIIDLLWWLFVTIIAIKFVHKFILSIVEDIKGVELPAILKLLINLVIIITATSLTLSIQFDREITALLAASGLLTAIIGFAIKENLSNLFSGLFLSMAKPFAIGDFIEINKASGFIEEIDWRSISLRTIENTIIIVPNSKVATSNITNLSKKPYFIITKTISVHPDHDPLLVKKLIGDSIEQTKPIDGSNNYLAHSVILSNADEKGLQFTIKFSCTDAAKMGPQTSNILLTTQRILINAGIRLSSGQLVTEVDGDAGIQALKPKRYVKTDYNNDSALLANTYTKNLKKQSIIEKVPLFNSLTHNEREILANNSRRIEVPEKTDLITQGEIGSSLYIIIEGVVAISILTDNEQSLEVARLGMGDFLGEYSLLMGKPRTATVTTVTSTTVLKITKEAIEPLLKSSPKTLSQISQIMATRQQVNESKKEEFSIHKEETTSLKESIENKIKSFFGIE